MKLLIAVISMLFGIAIGVYTERNPILPEPIYNCTYRYYLENNYPVNKSMFAEQSRLDGFKTGDSFIDTIVQEVDKEKWGYHIYAQRTSGEWVTFTCI